MVNIKHVRGLPGLSFFWSMVAILGNSVCRAHATASHAACHDNHENSNAWFSNFLCSYETYGAPLCGPSGRCGAPLLKGLEAVVSVLFTNTRTCWQHNELEIFNTVLGYASCSIGNFSFIVRPARACICKQNTHNSL